jgi:hypothetical protein
MVIGFEHYLYYSYLELSHFSESLNRIIEYTKRAFMDDIRSGLFSGFRFCRRDNSRGTTQEPEWDWKLTVQEKDGILSQEVKACLASYCRILTMSKRDLGKLTIVSSFARKDHNRARSRHSTDRLPPRLVFEKNAGVRIPVLNAAGGSVETLLWHTAAPYALSPYFLRCSCSFPNTCHLDCKWFWAARQWMGYNAIFAWLIAENYGAEGDTYRCSKVEGSLFAHKPPDNIRNRPSRNRRRKMRDMQSLHAGTCINSWCTVVQSGLTPMTSR